MGWSLFLPSDPRSYLMRAAMTRDGVVINVARKRSARATTAPPAAIVMLLLLASADARSTPPAAADAARSSSSENNNNPVPIDPDFKPHEEYQQGAMKDWSKFAAQIPRLLSKKNIQAALRRARELDAQPIPAQPTDPIVGNCVPFRPPAPFRTLQEYTRALGKAPWQVFPKMFREARAFDGEPNIGGIALGVRGCCAGVIAGNNMWAQIAHYTPLGDSWSGKCIHEDADGKPIYLDNLIFPFRVNARDWVKQRVPGDRMAKASVVLGTSWLDGRPAWVFDYSKVRGQVSSCLFFCGTYVFWSILKGSAYGSAHGCVWREAGNFRGSGAAGRRGSDTADAGRVTSRPHLVPISSRLHLLPPPLTPEPASSPSHAFVART